MQDLGSERGGPWRARRCSVLGLHSTRLNLRQHRHTLPGHEQQRLLGGTRLTKPMSHAGKMSFELPEREAQSEASEVGWLGWPFVTAKADSPTYTHHVWEVTSASSGTLGIIWLF